MTHESVDRDSSNLYWKFFPEPGLPDWECFVLRSHALYARLWDLIHSLSRILEPFNLNGFQRDKIQFSF